MEHRNIYSLNSNDEMVVIPEVTEDFSNFYKWKWFLCSQSRMGRFR